MGSFGLTQRVDPWLRADIESKEKNQPGAYQIVQQGSDGTWVPAGSRRAYYPLTWQSRADGLNIPIGFDFASLGEESRQTIERIEQTRRPALVPSPVRDQESGGRSQGTENGNQQSASGKVSPPTTRHSPPATSSAPSYWVFAPVVQGQTGLNALQPFGKVLGFSVAVLHPETILKRVIARAGSSSKFRITLRPAPPDSNPNATIQRIKGGWHYSHPLKAIDREWIFECSMSGTATVHRSTFALIIGLLITALMASQLLVLGSRTKKIEAEVRSRTDDLRIANTRLEQNLHERAQLEEQIHELSASERRQIGRDLHDSLGQKLTGAVFLSRSLIDYFSHARNQRSEIREQETGGRDQESEIVNQLAHAQTLNETLKSAVAQVRNMACGLAPVTLNEESLCEALEQLAEEMTGLYGVSCEVTGCDTLSTLGRKTKEQLYLIAREAVNNAARHAQAGHITIRLTGDETDWTLCVKDDGQGLPEQQSSTEGMGIRIMRHRAGLIGALFTITSAPNRGTRIEITSN